MSITEARICIRWWESGEFSTSLTTILIADKAISFVHGIMDGEAIADILDGKKEADVFKLC